MPAKQNFQDKLVNASKAVHEHMLFCMRKTTQKSATHYVTSLMCTCTTPLQSMHVTSKANQINACSLKL